MQRPVNLAKTQSELKLNRIRFLGFSVKNYGAVNFQKIHARYSLCWLCDGEYESHHLLRVFAIDDIEARGNPAEPICMEKPPLSTERKLEKIRHGTMKAILKNPWKRILRPIELSS